MSDGTPATLRYFLSYRGVSLPLVLVEELQPQDLRHRNTYFRAGHDADGRMLFVEKLVYGAVELRHDYHWTQGRLAEVVVTEGDEDPRRMVIAG